MPYIHLCTNREISGEKGEKLKSCFGKRIELIPGKSEQWLMVRIEDNCRLWFAGGNSPAAIMTLKAFGGELRGECYDALTSALIGDVSTELDIPEDRIYIEYENTMHWGWNGRNFGTGKA